MNSSGSRKRHPRRLKPYVAALAATAALAGGGQLLFAAPASAMVSNGPGCGQSWFDICSDSDEPGGGSGSGGDSGSGGGSGGGPTPDPQPAPEPQPGDDGRHEHIVVVPKKEIKVGGSSAGRPSRDKDLGKGKGPAGGAGRRPSCSEKKEVGCRPDSYKCVVDGKTWHAKDQKDCDELREKEERRKKAAEEQRWRDEVKCARLQGQREALADAMDGAAPSVEEKFWKAHFEWEKAGCDRFYP